MSIDSYQKKEFLDLLTKPWQKFFIKFKEIDSLPINDWKPYHYVAHFANLYNKKYNTSFSFSIKGAPSKCSEVFLMKRIIAMLGISNQQAIKEYINWIFEKKIQDKKIKSIGFLANTQFCNEFKIWRKENLKITRTTKLPNDYQQIVDLFELPVSTFGGLAFIKSALDMNPNDDRYNKLFNELYSIGFEFDMLKDIK
jgi:hypothetical protein